MNANDYQLHKRYRDDGLQRQFFLFES